MHIGRANPKSKTEAIFIPARSILHESKSNGICYKNADETNDITVDSDGFIKFTKKISPTLDQQSLLT